MNDLNGSRTADTVLLQTWPARPEHLFGIRSAVRRSIALLGLVADVGDDIVLAISEAASNAVEHAYQPPQPPGTVEVELVVAEGVLSISVRDHGRWLVRDEPAAADRWTRGRGLAIMRSVLDHVRVETGPSGTLVEAVVRIAA